MTATSQVSSTAVALPLFLLCVVLTQSSLPLLPVCSAQNAVFVSPANGASYYNAGIALYSVGSQGIIKSALNQGSTSYTLGSLSSAFTDASAQYSLLPVSCTSTTSCAIVSSSLNTAQTYVIYSPNIACSAGSALWTYNSLDMVFVTCAYLSQLSSQFVFQIIATSTANQYQIVAWGQSTNKCVYGGPLIPGAARGFFSLQQCAISNWILYGLAPQGFYMMSNTGAGYLSTGFGYGVVVNGGQAYPFPSVVSTYSIAYPQIIPGPAPANAHIFFVDAITDSSGNAIWSTLFTLDFNNSRTYLAVQTGSYNNFCSGDTGIGSNGPLLMTLPQLQADQSKSLLIFPTAQLSGAMIFTAARVGNAAAKQLSSTPSTTWPPLSLNSYRIGEIYCSQQTDLCYSASGPGSGSQIGPLFTAALSTNVALNNNLLLPVPLSAVRSQNGADDLATVPGAIIPPSYMCSSTAYQVYTAPFPITVTSFSGSSCYTTAAQSSITVTSGIPFTFQGTQMLFSCVTHTYDSREGSDFGSSCKSYPNIANQMFSVICGPPAAPLVPLPDYPVDIELWSGVCGNSNLQRVSLTNGVTTLVTGSIVPVPVYITLTCPALTPSSTSSQSWSISISPGQQYYPSLYGGGNQLQCFALNSFYASPSTVTYPNVITNCLN